MNLTLTNKMMKQAGEETMKPLEELGMTKSLYCLSGLTKDLAGHLKNRQRFGV